MKLKNRNPKTPPLIDPNYLHVKDDVDCMINSIKLAMRLVQSEVFQSLNPRIHWPRLRHCTNFGPTESDGFQQNIPNDRYLECLLRIVSITSHHPGGTCAMGSSLDNRLRFSDIFNFYFDYLRYVRILFCRISGIDGLRVVDASILPTTVAGTPNVVLDLIGRHVSDIISKELRERN